MLKKQNGKSFSISIGPSTRFSRLYREALKQAVSSIDRFVSLILTGFLFQAIDPKTGRVDVAILTTGISSGERRLRADLAQTMKRYLKEQKSSLSSEPMKKDQLFHDMRDRGDEQITRDMFDDAIRALEEENFLVATTHTIRLVTLGESNFDWETKGNEWARCRLCVGENIDLVLFFLYTYYWMQNEYTNKRSFLSRAMKSSVV